MLGGRCPSAVSSPSVASNSTCSEIVSCGAPSSRVTSAASPSASLMRACNSRRKRQRVILKDDHARQRIEQIEADQRALQQFG
jgi:hypothetical protein